MISINTNLSSLIAQSSLKSSTQLLNQAVERMTTGYKINHAKDNAANYSIATSMSTKLSAYDIAADNVAMGMDMLSTASSSLDLVSSHLMRLRDLTEQASNGTYDKQSLVAIQAEANARVDEIARIINSAEFNGQRLFERQGGMVDMPRKTDGEFISKVERLSESEAIAQGYTIIKTADDLQAMNDDLDGKYILMNDIDLNGYDWETIGYFDYDTMGYIIFTGELNGNGYEIQNLSLQQTGQYDASGLFGRLNGTVTNLGITNATINSQGFAGIIAGESKQGIIDNCYVTGSVYSKYDAGGIAGWSSGSISNSWADVNVSSYMADGVGGIAGNFNYGSITNCFASGNISGNYSIGGLVGWNEEGGMDIENSYSLCTLDIENALRCGGILGSDLTSSSSISNCYWVGDDSFDVTGNRTYGTITNAGCVTIEELLGANNVNFLVGINSDLSSIVSLDFAMDIKSLTFSLTDSDSARSCLRKIDNLLLEISDKQVEYGATESRLESAFESITVNIENLTSSLSTIRDADMAEVSSEYIRQQILQQASATLLSTANQSPAIALQLI